jgi:cobalt-zinc-cadmium efflux system outer membrane protein
MRIIIILIVFSFQAAVFGESSAVLELQRTALSSNPLIKAMESEAAMMKKRVPQSDALEDPKLKLGLNNLPAKSGSFTKMDMTSKEIGISQMIPLGKLPYRKKIAVQEYERAMVKFKAEKVETLHLLRMNYYELMYAVSSIRILADIKKQIKLVIDSEVAATKAGTGSIANVIKAKIEYNMVDEEIINLRQKEKELRATLNYLTGAKVDIKPQTLPVPDYREYQADEVQKEILASNP